MSSFPQLHMLHISDLHFGRNHVCRPAEPDGAAAGVLPLKDLLLRDLASPEWKKFDWANRDSDVGSPPFLLATTGDLTQQADYNEFNQAYDLLTGLARTPILGSEIGLRNVFVVPGNHDVVFDKPDPESRFAPYCNFYNKLFKPLQPEQRAFARPDEASSLSQIHVFPESRFLVAEINSCFYVEKETIDESRGQVDAQTIASLRKELEKYGDEAKLWIKIALMHHHPVLLPSFVEPGRGLTRLLMLNHSCGYSAKMGFS